MTNKPKKISASAVRRHAPEELITFRVSVLSQLLARVVESSVGQELGLSSRQWRLLVILNRLGPSTSGQSTFASGVFGVLSMFVGLFTAIKVFNWTATLYKGAIQVSAPFVYFMGFLYFLVFGGLTGIALSSVSLDVHWQDTYFVVAHFHFIMVGGTIMAFLAGLHYWWPKMFGKVYSERWALAASVLVILGFNATFIPQFLLGNMGMPRRYYSYPEQFQALNVASTAGASLLAFGFFLILFYLVASLVKGKVAGPNPWFSRGYEWNTPSPPDVMNFPETPVIDRGPHEYQDGPAAEVKHAH